MKFFSAILFSSVICHAANFGTAIFSGNGCNFAADKKIEFIKLGPDSYRITNQSEISKKAGSALLRQNCSLRIPIKLAAHEKIVISEISQAYKLQAEANAAVKLQLEVFLAGQESHPLTKEVNGKEKENTIKGQLKSETLIAESVCGHDVILAAKLETLLTGSGEGFAKTEAVDFKIQTKTCP